MSKLLLVINGAVLTGCAFFLADYSSDYRSIFITALLLFLPLLDKPLLDKNRQCYCLRQFKYQLSIWLAVGFCFLLLLSLNSHYLFAAISIVFLTALPEEWFFRAYFMQRLQGGYNHRWLANIVTSLLFTLLHIPLQGAEGLLVFLPSLLFGYIYQRSRNLILVVLIHALANLFFIIYIHDWVLWLKAVAG